MVLKVLDSKLALLYLYCFSMSNYMNKIYEKEKKVSITTVPSHCYATSNYFNSHGFQFFSAMNRKQNMNIFK